MFQGTKLDDVVEMEYKYTGQIIVYMGMTLKIVLLGFTALSLNQMRRREVILLQKIISKNTV
jgi:hypothetical protein